MYGYWLGILTGIGLTIAFSDDFLLTHYMRTGTVQVWHGLVLAGVATLIFGIAESLRRID